MTLEDENNRTEPGTSEGRQRLDEARAHQSVDEPTQEGCDGEALQLYE